MSALRRLWHRLISLGASRRLDREFDAEREAHVQLAADEYERRGHDPDEARRRARIAFGTRDATLELQRDSRGLPAVESLMADVGYACRGLRREPGLASIATLILAIGIGANTAVFSLIRPVLLQPLPFDDPETLVWVANNGTTGLSGATFQVSTYEALREQSRSFRDWTAYFAFFAYGDDTLTIGADPEPVSVGAVAPRFFELLGVQPSIGRLFTAAEQAPKGPDVVLITHSYWTRRFGSDPAIVGRHLTLNDRPTFVAGVLPEQFDFSSVFAPATRVDLFRPAVLDDMRPWGNTLSLIARLKPGTSVANARAELDVLSQAIRAAHPDWNRFGTTVTPLRDHVSGSMRKPFLVLWGAVGLVLLIVCANISNLLLARGMSRTKEFAIRLALGASRRRVFQQLAIEGVVLAGLGGAIGVPLAYALTMVVRQNGTLAIPMLYHARVDGVALAVTAAIAIGTGLVFSVLPGLRLSRGNPQSALSEQARGSTTGRRHAWVRSALVIVEVALACVLLVGAGLLGRSLLHLLDADLGFRPSESTVLTLKTPSDRTPAQTAALVHEAARRVRSLPGIDAAGLTDALPLGRNRSFGVGVPGQTYAPGQRPQAFAYIVGPGYFRAMGMSPIAGRDFAETDTPDSTQAAVVSESLARILYPGQDAIGRPAQIRSSAPHTIVGVVADVRQSRLDEPAAAQLYLSSTQGLGLARDLVVRSRAPASAFLGVVRQTLTAIDPTLVVADVRPLTELVDRSVSPRRFVASLLTGFSIFALLLACLGIYGVVSYGVSQRVQEIGVRMALGATGSDVRRHVLAGTFRLTAIGIVIGLAMALALGRLIAGMLFQTSPTDPWTFAWTALALLTIACAAGYLPALRASRIAPMRALHGGSAPRASR